MSRVKYKVEYLDSLNQIRHVVVEAKDAEEAMQKVIANPDVQALVSINRELFIKEISLAKYKKADLSSLAFISTQFSQMFHAGLPVNSMLNIFIRTIKNPYLRKIFENISLDIQSGVSFYRAFSKYESYFGSFFINMIKVGEVSGNLDKIFQSLADYYNYFINIKNRLINVMIYPLFVIFAVLLVWALAMFFVVPKFKQIFVQMIGLEKIYKDLPLITVMVIKASDLYTSNLKILGFTINMGFMLYMLKFSIFGILFYMWKNVDLRKNLEYILLKIPVISNIIKYYYCSIFFKALHTTLTNGISIISSLEMSSAATTSSLFSQKIKEVISSIEQGKKLSDSLINTKFFEPIVEQMLITGERSGTIYKMLSEADRYYSTQMEVTIERAMRLIEPTLIVIVGGFVFFILLALYLPVFILPSKIIR
ncbi:MAG: type II secretion system F family protein [bacterium]